MHRQRIIIVGGVASGPAAAAQARRTDPDADIVLYERGRSVSYGACELPYFATGAIEDVDALVRLTPEKLARTRRIDVRTLHEVTGVDVAGARLSVIDHVSGIETDERYDKLILATGARAADSGIEGAEGPDCHVLRTLEDGVRLRSAVEDARTRHAVIVGGGFIGLEVATLLGEAGWRVTVLDPGGPLGAHLDAPLIELLDERLARTGIAVRRDRAEAVRRPRVGPSVAVRTAGGELVGAGLLLIAAGIEPVSGLGGAAIRRGVHDTYTVDPSMRTSARNVWACGDCVSVPAFPDGKHRWIPLSPVAFRGARVAGHNAARSGRSAGESLPAPVGNFTASIAGWEVASVGLTKEAASALGIDAGFALSRHVTASSLHPASRPIHVGLVFERPSGRLLGAQLLGEKGAAVRADVVAAVLQAGGTVTDLYEVDYAYAPPVAPALDPLMIAARTAQKAIASR